MPLAGSKTLGKARTTVPLCAALLAQTQGAARRLASAGSAARLIPRAQFIALKLQASGRPLPQCQGMYM
jgi:hypothetical protein